jgi:hypothetical protein
VHLFVLATAAAVAKGFADQRKFLLSGSSGSFGLVQLA